MNKLYYGDCLTIMREMESQSVDLIYLDPPFNSNRTYNAIYKDETGRSLPDQIEAFCDLWTLDEERERAIRNMPLLMRKAGIADETVEFWRLWMSALRGSQPKLLAYLSYMVQRLVMMKGLLRPTGSIYLHCDTTASHYIKVMMDGIFGHENFRNEIVWKRFNFHADAKRFGRVTDRLLFYSASPNYRFETQRTPYKQSYIDSHFRKIDAAGKRFQLSDLNPPAGRGPVYEFHGVTKPWRYTEEKMRELEAQGLIYVSKRSGPRLKRYLADLPGEAVTELWTDVFPINSQAKERMGYDTQKPLALLKRIIKASTKKGDLVLDPFCGCATTLEAAQTLGRDWIGIDIAIHAVKRVAKKRLGERCKLVEGTDFTISGVPRNLEGVKDLWERDKYHFQKWAVEEVDGFVTTKCTADGGIDGRLYFGMPGEKDLQSMVLEVKGGANVPINDLRALRGVLEREEAVMAGLIIMFPLGGRKANNFAQEAAEAGDLEVMGKPYPRLQVLSVPEILEGKRFDTPGVVGKVGQVNLRLASG